MRNIDNTYMCQRKNSYLSKLENKMECYFSIIYDNGKLPIDVDAIISVEKPSANLIDGKMKWNPIKVRAHDYGGHDPSNGYDSTYGIMRWINNYNEIPKANDKDYSKSNIFFIYENNSKQEHVACWQLINCQITSINFGINDRTSNKNNIVEFTLQPEECIYDVCYGVTSFTHSKQISNDEIKEIYGDITEEYSKQLIN